jgi:hypothetical protein
MTIAITPPVAGQQAPRRKVLRREQPAIVAPRVEVEAVVDDDDDDTR